MTYIKNAIFIIFIFSSKNYLYLVPKRVLLVLNFVHFLVRILNCIKLCNEIMIFDYFMILILIHIHVIY